MAAREAPENIDVAVTLGEALMSRGGSAERLLAQQQFARALGFLDRKLQRLRKNSIDISPAEHLERARCLAALGRFPEAVTEITEVMAATPDNRDAWLMDSIVAAMDGKKSQALQSMRKANQLGVSIARMEEEWPLRPLLKEFQGDELPAGVEP